MNYCENDQKLWLYRHAYLTIDMNIQDGGVHTDLVLKDRDFVYMKNEIKNL